MAVCGLLGARLLGGADDTVPVWSLRGDRVAGQSLGAGDLVPVRIRFGTASDADRYLSAADPLPEDAVLSRDVSQGELLPRGAIGSPGGTELVALPVTVPSEDVPATVRAGSRIDVWVTPEDASRAELVLQDVPVLALGTAEKSLSPNAGRQLIVGLDELRQRGLAVSLAALGRGAVVVTTRAGR